MLSLSDTHASGLFGLFNWRQGLLKLQMFTFFWSGHLRTTSIISALSQPKTFREQDDIEGGINIRLRGEREGLAQLLGFRRFVPISLDLLSDISSLLISKVCHRLARPTGYNHQVDIVDQVKKQAKLSFLTTAGDRRRLSMTTETRQIQS